MTDEQPPALTQRYILGFWSPLAASWMLMTLEGPIIQAALARLSDPQTNLAAMGIVSSLSVTIESPVIMLLATSTALCRNRAAYLVLRRFMLWLNLLLTGVAALVAFTPFFDLVVPGAMGVPGPIAEAVRPGMRIMILWSAAIGWRRFYQGILIRFGQTRRVTYGTLLRLTVSGGTAVMLAWWGELPGVWVGSCGLMAGVLAEAALVTWLVRPTLALRLSDASSTTNLTTRRVLGFHAPLAATSVLMLLSQPLVSAGLARAASAEQSLAAWPVMFSLVLFTRSFGLATQEVIIALSGGPATQAPLRRFVRNIVLFSTLTLVLLAFTPLAPLYLRQVTGISSELIGFVAPGLRVSLLLPGLTVLHSWQRARLMKGESTSSIYQAMTLNLAVTAAALALGVALHAPGVQMGALALTVAMLAELFFLSFRTRRLTNAPLPNSLMP